MYYIFISHSWGYSDHYQSIVGFLDTYLKKENYKDYSVPQNDPIHTNGTRKDLLEKLDNKIRLSSCVIIPTGIYDSYSESIQAEIDIALKYDKPIIAVRPRGAERQSKVATDNATIIVGWNGNSIANAVRELCD